MLLDNSPRNLYLANTVKIPAIDALKFICALMVVGIHVNFFISPYVLFIYRIAVPVFFIISGYFIVSNNGLLESSKIYGIVRKILLIALTANILYYIEGCFLFKKVSYPLIPTIIEGNTICHALWYLNAYIEVLLMLLILIKLKWTGILPYIAFTGVLFGLFVGAYNWLLDTKIIINYYGWNFNSARNAFTIGLPCVTIGIIIREYENVFRHYMEKHPFSLKICLTFFFILSATEYFFMDESHKYSDIFLFTIPLGTVSFLIALLVRPSHKSLAIAKLGKKYSLPIYLYHLIFLDFIFLVLHFLNCREIVEIKYMQYWLYPALIIIMLISFIMLQRLKSIVVFKNIWHVVK